MTKNRFFQLIISCFLLAGCAAGMGSVIKHPATSEYITATYYDLKGLPPLKEKIVVSVSNFNDETGQYKGAQDYSTAVSQGVDEFLIHALMHTDWYMVAERKIFSQLRNERNIVVGSRKKHIDNGDAKNGVKPILPLAYSAIILTGGITSYERDQSSGNFGLSYYGIEGFTESRRDMVTVSLRAVSVNNSLIIGSVSTTKTIYSKLLRFGFFRFVREKSLLQAETGIAANEPSQMAIKEAIERAVLELSIEGLIEGYWHLADPDDFKTNPVIQRYMAERNGSIEMVLGKKEMTKKKDKN